MPRDTVEYIQLSIISEEEWRRLAVCIVSVAASYQVAIKSKEGTLFDERMGSTTPGVLCQTCHAPESLCPGHFGLIELPVPVYNKLFVEWIKKLLECVCAECGRLRLQPSQLASYELPKACDARIKAVHARCMKLTQCAWPDCCSILPTIRYDKDTSQFQKSYGEAVKGKKEVSHAPPVILTSEEILTLFKKMDAETIEFLQFNNSLHTHSSLYHKSKTGRQRVHRHAFRPENMIYTVLPVIPPCARPYVIRDGQIHDDDLATQYNYVLKDCAKIRGLDRHSPEAQQAILSLQKNVWSIVTQEVDKKKPQPVKRKVKALQDRMKDKDGRIQGNIVGKRANFTARGVIISGGLLLKENELGVPEYVANRQTIRETVLPWNIHVLQELVRRRRVISVTRTGEGVKRLDAMEGGGVHFILREGDRIDRKLQDGDDVVFNRQPTIRLESFQHFKVKIVPGYAFRLGLTYVSAFNADQRLATGGLKRV